MSHEYSGTRHNVQRRKPGPNKKGFPRPMKGGRNKKVYDERAPMNSDLEACKRIKKRTPRYQRDG
jgi:hypothetical protein